MIGREGALVLLLGAFTLSKLTAQGKRHEFIKHFGTTKSGGDFSFFFFIFFFSPGIKSLRWKISPSSVLAPWGCLAFTGVCTSVITHHVCLYWLLGGEAHNSPWHVAAGPPEEHFCCHRSRTTGLQRRPPTHGQAHGTGGQPGWDTELLVLTSAPKAAPHEHCRHKPSQGTPLVIPPSNLSNYFFSLRYARYVKAQLRKSF